MKKFLFMAIAGAFALSLIAGCAGTRKGGGATDDNMGRLIKESNKLKKMGYITAVATDMSEDLQTAIDKAALRARAEITRSIQSKVKEYQDLGISDAGVKSAELTKAYDDGTRLVAEELLKGSIIVESPYIKNDDGKYEAFVLVQVDQTLFYKYMKDRVNSNDALKAQFEKERIFEKADKELEEYEKERAKNQE
jgi:hypothetical protein